MKQIIKKLSVFLLILGMCTSAVAQSPKFIVYFVSGKCTKVVSGKVTVLQKGDKLQTTDLVRVAAGGKAILICSNFNTTQLTRAAEYKVKTLFEECSKQPTSFTASYFHFIWDEFSHPHSSPEKEPEKYMKTAGAVTRGKEPVELRLPLDTIRYFSGPLTIKFVQKKDSANFVLHKVEGRKLTIQQSARYTGAIPIAKLLSGSNAGTYQWQLADANNPKMKGSVHTVLLYSEADYKKNIEALLKGVVNSNTAETAFMKAFVLEKHAYVAEAIKYYQQALKLQPANKIYKELAGRF